MRLSSQVLDLIRELEKPLNTDQLFDFLEDIYLYCQERLEILEDELDPNYEVEGE